MDRIKLPRVYNGKDYYKTGEDQRWTYEYTYEDFKAAKYLNPTAPSDSPEIKLQEKIIKYFQDNPDIAKKNGVNPYSIV